MKKLIMAGVCASLIFGVYSCKKEKFDPSSNANSKENYNNQKRIAGTFDPDSWTDTEVQSEIEDFISELNDGSLVNMDIEQSVWYVEAALNSSYTNYIPFTHVNKKTYSHDVAVSNSEIGQSDINLLITSAKSDINSFIATLPASDRNILYIDVESNSTISNGNASFTIQIVCNVDGILQSPPPASSIEFDRTVNSAGYNEHIPYNGAKTTPSCPTTSGTNDWMAPRANYNINDALYNANLPGGSVQIFSCNGQAGLRVFNVGVKRHPIESTFSSSTNRIVADQSTYPYNCYTKTLTATWNLANCVGSTDPEINYYTDKSLNHGRSTSFYTASGIPTNKKPIEMWFKFGNETISGITKGWQTPIANYARCSSYIPPVGNVGPLFLGPL